MRHCRGNHRPAPPATGQGFASPEVFRESRRACPDGGRDRQRHLVRGGHADPAGGAREVSPACCSTASHGRRFGRASQSVKDRFMSPLRLLIPYFLPHSPLICLSCLGQNVWNGACRSCRPNAPVASDILGAAFCACILPTSLWLFLILFSHPPVDLACPLLLSFNAGGLCMGRALGILGTPLRTCAMARSVFMYLF